MANNTLKTRILICNDTTANWATSAKVLLKGEMAIEFLTDGTPKFKVGDGTNTFAALPYAAMTPAEVATAITNAVDAAKHTHANKATLDAIEVALTNALKKNYDAAYTHSTQAHAPSNAQANVIETVKVNGTALTPTSKAVDVTVPTKVSQLTNDAGYKTTDNNTTYGFGANSSATNGSAAITLTGSDGTKPSVTIKGTGATTVTTDANGAVIVNSTNTVYTHPNSGVTAGTYKSVTVNAQGHVTAGSNPTTLAGYGITDAAAKSHTHGNADITSLDASKLTGTIDIARLPQGALERCVVVADDTARFALTTAKVQQGDTVKVTATGKMYFVVDDTKLNAEAGYEVYTAGSATSVPWSGVTGKPSTFTPSAHNQAISTITGLQAALDGKAANSDFKGATADAAGTHGLVKAPAAGDQGKYLKADGTWGVPTNTTYNDMKGASASAAGTHGLVPAPAAGNQGKFLRGDGTWQTPTDTNNAVTNTLATTTKAYVTGTTSASTNTGGQVFDTGVYLDTTAGTLTATTFKGALSGKASSATKLATARSFSITGAATASAVNFDGSANVVLNLTYLNAMSITVASSDTLILDGGGAA